MVDTGIFCALFSGLGLTLIITAAKPSHICEFADRGVSFPVQDLINVFVLLLVLLLVELLINFSKIFSFIHEKLSKLIDLSFFMTAHQPTWRFLFIPSGRRY